MSVLDRLPETREITSEVEVDDLGWSMVHLDEDFSQRFLARSRGPDARESAGEVFHDQGVTWHPEFTVTYRRVE